MEAHILEIATSAGRTLINPFVATVPLLWVLALVTGVANRIAIVAEDLLYDFTNTPNARNRRSPLQRATLHQT